MVIAIMDQDLHQRVDDAIQSSPHVRRRMRIHAIEGRITIVGNVPTYFQKQMIQETVKQVDGVEAIDNQVVVTW
jgi:osmotically-inducible protein OsmY